MRLIKFTILACAFFLTCPALLAFSQAVQPATAAALPSITSISPATGSRGSTVTVTLTGTDFESGLTINAGDGVVITKIQVSGTTTATADFTIADSSSLGQHNVTVTTSGGTSPPKAFTVNPAPPTFTSITPASGLLGGIVNVTLSGTNFVPGLTIDAGADITVRSVSAINSSTATATLSIAPTAALGGRNITVTNGGGTSGALVFTVLAPPPPTLTSISPGTGVPNSVLSVTLSGTNFISGLSVDAINGITVTSVAVSSPTTATAVFTIAADAPLGARSVTVTTAGGTSAPASFAVAVVPPSLTGISPSGAAQGATVTVTLTGSSFATGMTIEAITEITVSAINVTSSNAATATFVVDSAATPGARQVRVTTAGGTSGPVTFTVLPPPPTLTAITPASGLLGTSPVVTLTGTNFAAPMTIALGSDIVAKDITVVDSTTAAAIFAIGLGATPGVHSVTVTTPGGSASAALFSVVPLPPTLTSLSPSSAVQSSLGRSFLVTLTGTNLIDPTIAISGTGVKAPPNVVVTSGTTGTAVFTVDGDAPLGARNVTISTAGGTSAPVAFTVLPPAPTLTSITPAIGVRGTSVNVTVLGTNFATGTTLNVPGITVSNPVVVNGITLTATLTIPANATLGAYSVTAATSLGTTNALTFTVADPFPDLSITSSHSGRFGVGFDEPYTVTVTNTGVRATTGAISVTDTLPPGLGFVSAVGAGWSCSPTGQTLACNNANTLAAGASSSYTLTVRVDASAAAAVNHTVSVTTPGDTNTDNNSATDPTTIAPIPSPVFAFSPLPLVAGEQATMSVRVATSFPHDVTGTATLTFVSTAVIPVDDPAIQFASGGRAVTFTIPANTTLARFASASDATSIGFQTGTVAGSLIFAGTFKAGSIQGVFAPPIGGSAPSIAHQAPVIKSIETSTEGGFAATILLFSTPREVTELSLRFNARVKLSCGTSAGCTASGNTITFDVTALFAAWYAKDTTYGSLNQLRLPLNIDGGKVTGTVDVVFRNKQGLSNVMSFDLAPTVHFGG